MKENKQLLDSIISGIQEKKGKNITTIDLRGMPGVICDYFVICEGNSPSQVSAVAESVEHIVKTNIKESPIRVQGQQLAEWVGIDYGDIIVHVFMLSPCKRMRNVFHSPSFSAFCCSSFISAIQPRP